jgi:hypothetical protein
MSPMVPASHGESSSTREARSGLRILAAGIATFTVAMGLAAVYCVACLHPGVVYAG